MGRNTHDGRRAAIVHRMVRDDIAEDARSDLYGSSSRGKGSEPVSIRHLFDIRPVRAPVRR